MNAIYNTIFVNGEAFNCFSKMSLYDLLIYLDFDIHGVIVEYNQKIVFFDNFHDIFFKNQDRLEIITIVGGG
nr:Thiamine biosynthesis protein [Calliblepharis sp.]